MSTVADTTSSTNAYPSGTPAHPSGTPGLPVAGRSGTSLLDPTAGPSRGEVRGISFPTLLRVEARKLVDTTAGRWLLISIALLTVVVLVVNWFFRGDTPAGFDDYLSSTATPLAMLLPVLGVLAATSEWSQRTALTTFALEPRRGRVVAAKLLSAVLFGALLVAVAIGLAVATNALAIAVGHPNTGWTMTTGLLWGFALAMLLAVAQGVGFGMVIPNTAAAIVTSFMLPQAFTLLMMWDKFRDVRQWIDMNQALAPMFDGSSMSGTDWGHLASSAAIWVVLPVVAGTWIWRRREVK